MHGMWFDYSGQSTEALLALEGEYGTDRLVMAFEQAVDQKTARVGIERLTDEERVILAIEALEREVNNGGYSQFFGNTSKDFAGIIVDALHRIGCPKTADITQAAITSLGIRGPIAVQAIDNAMAVESDDREQKLRQCDDEYFGAGEEIADKLLDFIKKNRSKIAIGENRGV